MDKVYLLSWEMNDQHCDRHFSSKEELEDQAYAILTNKSPHGHRARSVEISTFTLEETKSVRLSPRIELVELEDAPDSEEEE